jgi:hypothetical protein
MSLHQMSEDLQELAANMERGRKHWKQSGLNAEKRVQDSELALEKAKARYYALAEQYDRARTGDRQTGRFGLKGPKSAAQQEEDLYRKLQAADAEYATRVQAAQDQREELRSALRPQAVAALRELIAECDAGLTLQLQKFASVNEQLLLRNGLCINPLKGSQTNGATSESRSLRDIAQQIDNEGDFRDYIMSFSNKAGTQSPEIKYERHPALGSPKPTQAPQFTQQQSFGSQPAGFGNQPQSPRVPSGNYEQAFRPSQPGQISGVTPYQPSSRDGTQMPGQQNQYQSTQPTPYGFSQQDPTTSNPPTQYGPNQHNQFAPGPHNQHPPNQQSQSPQSARNERPSSQQTSYPHAPSSYPQNTPSIYTNAQLPQLPQIGSLSLPPTEPPSRHDGMGMGPPNNSTGQDSRPGAASPVSQATGLRNASMPGGPSGRLPGSYWADGASSAAGMSGALGATRADPPAAGPSATNRQDVLPTGPQSNGRFQNPQVAPNSGYAQSPAMKAPTQPQSRPMNVDSRGPGNQPPSHGMSVDPRVAGNNPRLGASRQPGINAQNPGMAPSSFGTPSSKSRADGPRPSLPPLRPVFGVSLDELFRRDGSAVPMIVYQCVQAVDLFGLDTEGIYRISGSAPHIMEMKAMFDHGEQ